MRGVRGLVVVALLVAIVGSAWAAHDVWLGGASTRCSPLAVGWRGRVTGVRLEATQPGLETRVLQRVNAFRRAHGKASLVRSLRLTWAARYHSLDMRDRGRLEHERAGESFTQRFARFSPSSCVAENIAVGYATAGGVVTAWANSPGHRHVLLLPWVRRAGVGIAGSYVTFDASS